MRTQIPRRIDCPYAITAANADILPMLIPKVLTIFETLFLGIVHAAALLPE
jgi:hypothetical protein